jgi:flagellar hook-associated protein 3 FlgL
MRISSSYLAQLFVASQNQQEAALATTQQQVSTGLQFSEPSQNPTAASQVLGLNATLGETTQYGTNANLAQSRLNIESSTLTSVINTLQSARSLALEANNATENASSKASLAQQIQAASASLLQLANTKDGTGQYIFGGTATGTLPFTQGPGGTVVYNGTQDQRLIQIGADAQVADGDSGASVFQQIPNGNGTFVASAAAGNTGSGVIGATSVTSPSAWAAGSPPYTIAFADAVPATTPPTLQYTVTDHTGATVVPATNYTDGQAIAFNGATLTMSGTPAPSDTFTVASSTHQDVFTTLQSLVTALTASASTGGQTPTSNSINQAIDALDQALTNVSNVQTQVGTRLQSIDSQTSTNSAFTLQVQGDLSNLQDLNYASAITTLNQQMTALQAAQESYAKIQGLSLFNYIQ